MLEIIRGPTFCGAAVTMVRSPAFVLSLSRMLTQ